MVCFDAGSESEEAEDTGRSGGVWVGRAGAEPRYNCLKSLVFSRERKATGEGQAVGCEFDGISVPSSVTIVKVQRSFIQWV